jgi:uncharacterized protein YjbI with pentapeptide repeats
VTAPSAENQVTYCALLRAPVRSYDLTAGLFHSGCRFYGANLDQAELQGANLRQIEAIGANLEFAKMQGAALEGANLLAAKLDSAEIMGGDFNHPLTEPNQAFLAGVSLIDTNLQGVDLRHALLI